MKSVLGDLINEEADKCQHSSKVETKIEAGCRKKTNAERQREYRQRLKAKKAQNKKVKHRKTNAEMCKQYRDRLREEKLITKYYSNILSTNKKNKLNDNNEDKSIWKKIYTVSTHSNEEQIQQHISSQENNKINLSLQGIYEEFYECVMPNVILCHETDIPADGNCLFHSLIRILQLSISTTELRKQLLDSPYLYSCNDPHNASKILRSDFEYGDLDCIFIFSRVYSINICIHYHFLNKAKKEDARYSYFKVNGTGKVIHLHLTGNHFTPYVESLHISQENKSSSLNDENITFQADDQMQDPCDNNYIANRIKAEKYSHEKDMPFECEERDVEIKEGSDCKDMIFKDDATISIYSNYSKHSQSHYFFLHDFKDNSFGHSCPICDRLWCKKDLKKTSKNCEYILQQLFPNYTSDETMEVCSTCKAALDKNKIPLLSTYNGFSYPQIPSILPKLNFIEQRLISPKIPFIQIRRLRHVNGQDSIYGQIINIPIEINTMVKKLPRNFEDDHSFYVHLKKKIINKSSYVNDLIKKNNIKQWLSYLVNMPLYVHHEIEMDNSFFKSNVNGSQLTMDDVSEQVPPDDKFMEQQQTLMWNEDNFFHIAPGENKTSLSLLFDTYAEELSFPTIYGGQFRTYREGIIVTPFMQATSELLRTDRRAADPQHLLYIAAKIMRLRVSQCISMASKHFGHDAKITKENIQSEDYIHSCIETNFVFLHCIPNSVWFWTDRKKDLFAMIRQLGAPTAFMTLSANETGWTDLLNLLYKLKNDKVDISEDFIAEMSYVHKSQLVNEDAVTCVIYFNKLINSLLKVLQSKRGPFGKYKVNYYFKRIEFQHRGSPLAHILLWLENKPDLLSNNPEFINMVDELVSVSANEASGNINLQMHKHNFTCFKKMDPNKKQIIRCGAPFLPSKTTITLIPMKDSDLDVSKEDIKKYKKHFKMIRKNLENFDYTDFNQFFTYNNIESDEHYQKILRAGIDKPKLFYKRLPSETWHNPFNPFVLHHLKSSMNFQIIIDEYACAPYVAEYVDKHKRVISNLQKQIIEIMDENPEFDIADITNKISFDLLHSVEMTAQEAAWYLLREPMAKSSIATVYIPTMFHTERLRIRKTVKELNALDNNCTDIWKENWFDKYERRPDKLNHVTLAQFVSKYYIKKNGDYAIRKTPNVIRYRNYDMANNFNDYRREMVLLHIPFRSEEKEVIADNKFIQIYNDNKDLIMERRKEFESNLDIHRTLEICKQLCRQDENGEEDESEEDDKGIQRTMTKGPQPVKNVYLFDEVAQNQNFNEVTSQFLQLQREPDMNMFFQNLEARVSLLDPELQIKVKIQIMNIVAQFEMENISLQSAENTLAFKCSNVHSPMDEEFYPEEKVNMHELVSAEYVNVGKTIKADNIVPKAELITDEYTQEHIDEFVSERKVDIIQIATKENVIIKNEEEENLVLNEYALDQT